MLLFLLCTLSTLSHGIHIIIQCIIYDLEVTKLIKLMIELIKCKSKIRAMHGAAAPFHCRNHQLIYILSIHACILPSAYQRASPASTVGKNLAW